MDLDSFEIKHWRKHPATEELVNRLLETVEERRKMWGRGVFTHESVEATAMRNAQEIAYVQAIEAVVDAIDGMVEEAEEES